MVNLYRQKNGLKEVSWSAVNDFAARSEKIKTQKRGTTKSGKGAESAWAKKRLTQCKEWVAQLDPSAELPPGCRRVYLEALVFWDEHHKKTRLGHATKYENRISQNAEGKFCNPDDGGVFPAQRPTTSQKFAQDARVCCGVAMRKDLEGILEGVKAEMFDYTGKIIVGLIAYFKAIQAELKRVCGLKGVWRNYPNGYKDRYPDNWEEIVGKCVQRKLVLFFLVHAHACMLTRACV